MTAIIQRVSFSSVSVDNKIIGSIGKGLNILLGVRKTDAVEDAAYLAKKISDLRIFEDDRGKMNLSIKDVGGQMLIISQFTLLADLKKGNRPSFTNAAQPDEANKLYKEFIRLINLQGVKTQEGQFGAHMTVEIINDGPVSIILDSRDK